MWDLCVFDSVEFATARSNLCPGSSILNNTVIPIIFCRHIFWVVPECSAKYRPSCWRFHKMAAIFNILFSTSILVIPSKVGRDISWGKRHLCWEYDLKWPLSREMVAILNVKNCIFAPFSNMRWNYFLWCLVNFPDYPSAKLWLAGIVVIILLVCLSVCPTSCCHDNSSRRWARITKFAV